MKTVHAVVPLPEPITIAVRENIDHKELRISVVRRDGEKKADLRIWDFASDGSVTPRRFGYTLSMQEAAALRDALDQVLKNA